MGLINISRISGTGSVPTPPQGVDTLFNSNGIWYFKDSNGIVTTIAAGIVTATGPAGPAGTSGSSGSSGVSGTSGSSGSSGISGTSGSSGSSGVSGTSGSSGSSGINGTSGSDGSSGTSGVDGTSGTSGSSGSSGSSGVNGTSGINGTSGSDGSSGTSGIDGTSGSSGSSGTSGSAGTSGTSIVNNKTFITLTDGATVSWDYTTGYNAKVTLGGNRSLSITGATNGDYGTLFVIQDGSGNRRINFSSSDRFASGTYSFATASNAIDIYSFVYDGTHFYWNSNTRFS